MSKRESLLSSSNKKVTTYGPQPLVCCVRCFCSLTPGMHYFGSVIDGIGIATQEIVKRERMATEFTIERKRFSFYKRKRGPLCDDCAANYHTITDQGGVKHPLVITDPRPGYIGLLAIPVVERLISECDEGDEGRKLPHPAPKGDADNQWLNVGRKK